MSDANLEAAVRAFIQTGTYRGAAKLLGIPASTLQGRVETAKIRGLLPATEVLHRTLAEDDAIYEEALVEDAPPAPKPTVWEKQISRWQGAQPAAPAFIGGPQHTFTADRDGWFTFGACGDQHMCSKYERLEVNEALYDAYQEAGVSTVFNTGNWIDGVARFNVHDLHTIGLDGQMRYLAANYPQRKGITTYAITGDDHEGWYAQREGINVGAYAATKFLDAGRRDWVDLGYMEAPVRILHPDTGRGSVISIVHPGGGSAYAISYSIQKIIESLDGGEKPAIGLYGHYHKLWFGNIRNVFCVQTGCGQDQTPFMRKKKLEAHVGGTLIRAKVDPESGAIVRCSAEIIRFFNKGYYTNRWSHSGPVNKGERV